MPPKLKTRAVLKEKDDPALDAMLFVQQQEKPVVMGHTLPQGFKELFNEFRRSLEAVNPNGTFTVPVIWAWAQEYENILTSTKGREGFALPDGFGSTYALGRILKRDTAQDALGIEMIGSYGNRPIYVLKEEANGEGS